MLDVIDVTIHRAFFFLRAHQHGIYADDPTAFTDHVDLLIANVALDVVIAADICVRHDGWLCNDGQNFVKTGWVDVCKINDHAKLLAFADYVTSEAR